MNVKDQSKFVKVLMLCALISVLLAGNLALFRWLLLSEVPQNRKQVLKVFFSQVDNSDIRALDFVHRARQGGYRIYARVIADKEVIRTILQGAEKAEIRYSGDPNTSEISKVVFKREEDDMGITPFAHFVIEHLDPWKHNWWDLDEVENILKMELFYAKGGNQWTKDFRHWWIVDWERPAVYLIGGGS